MRAGDFKSKWKKHDVAGFQIYWPWGKRHYDSAQANKSCERKWFLFRHYWKSPVFWFFALPCLQKRHWWYCGNYLYKRYAVIQKQGFRVQCAEDNATSPFHSWNKKNVRCSANALGKPAKHGGCNWRIFWNLWNFNKGRHCPRNFRTCYGWKKYPCA